MVRFAVICFFFSLAVVILGVFLIDNLFDETKVFAPPEIGEGLAGLAGQEVLRPSPVQNQLRIYFTKDGATLSPETFAIQSDAPAHERGRRALEKLLQGPSTDLFQRTTPERTRIRGFYLDEGEGGKVVAVIDLSEEVKKTPMGGLSAELLCLYSVVNTALANCAQADYARILVEGKSVETLWGAADLTRPIVPGALIAN
jgi:hypothetical protein